MDKLQELLDKFRNDESWNTKEKNGSRRFDAKILWIESMIKGYSEKLSIPINDVVEIVESKRNCSWPNYYQEANFPPLDSSNLIGVFKTFDEFNATAKEKRWGFECPRCKSIGTHPQECDHRIAKDGICDWCSYGLFHSSVNVVILESGLKSIAIFQPVVREDSNG